MTPMYYVSVPFFNFSAPEKPVSRVIDFSKIGAFFSFEIALRLYYIDAGSLSTVLQVGQFVAIKSRLSTRVLQRNFLAEEFYKI